MDSGHCRHHVCCVGESCTDHCEVRDVRGVSFSL